MSTEIIEPAIGTSEGGFKTPSDIFSYQSNPIGQAVSNAGSSVFDFFSNLLTPKASVQATDTATQTVRTNLPLRTIAASAGAIGTGVTIYATTTNPGVHYERYRKRLDAYHL